MNDEITVTEQAIERIALIRTEEEAGWALRAFITGGGCSGFQYGFAFDENVAEDDYVIEKGDVKVVIDALSYQYLVGSTIDYENSLMGSRFIINNPNATTTCGCGASFSI